MDVAIALLICYLTIEGSRSDWRPVRVAIVGLVGALAIWFSHPTVFVLAGIGTTISVAAMARKDWSTLARAGVAFLMWAVNWVICYLVVLRQLARDDVLLDYWKTNFMPFPPRSATDFKWFVDSFFGFFGSSAGLTFAGLAGLVFFIGCLSMVSKNREMLFLLLSPAIAALFASALHRYPFGGRLTLFLVPAALLFMAEGAHAIHSATTSRLPIGALLIGLLFFDPCMYVLHHFGKPHTELVWPGVMIVEEIRPVMSYLRTHEQPGDLVYVFSESEPAFEYYQERDGFPQSNVRIGTASGDDPQNYASDLTLLRGKRAWILLSHIHGAGAGESKHVKFYLDMLGKRIDAFARAGAETWLYDLRSAGLAPSCLRNRTLPELRNRPVFSHLVVPASSVMLRSIKSHWRTRRRSNSVFLQPYVNATRKIPYNQTPILAVSRARAST
jgi:hypothetical protein